jgi:hypothetical protein
MILKIFYGDSREIESAEFERSDEVETSPQKFEHVGNEAIYKQSINCIEELEKLV